MKACSDRFRSFCVAGQQTLSNTAIHSGAMDPIFFATGNDFHDEELPYQGQLNKIHFLKDYQQLGLGRKLVATVVKRFLQQGISSMILFADPQNPNIAFYDTLGGEKILDKEGRFHGAYGWHDLDKLLDICNASK